MDAASRQFVERMGLVCEKEGLARSAGRIFALLLLTDQPLSLDAIAETLQVSKASVSTNARVLESLGFLERVSTLGDRRDFYRAQPDPWGSMIRGAQGRWREMVGVLREAQASLPAEDAVAQARLHSAERFHELLIERGDALLDEWRERTHGDAEA